MSTSSPSPSSSSSPSPSSSSSPPAPESGLGSGAAGSSRRGSTASTPRTLSPSTTPSQHSRRHSTGHIHTSPKLSSRSTSPSCQPTSGEYDMSLIGDAPLTITRAASGVTAIVPGPPVKSTGSSTARRVTPRTHTRPSPNPNPHPPSPAHKKLSNRPPIEHKPDDLLRSWRRDETRSPSPHSTQDDTKMIPKEQKMTNVHYTRGRRGSIDDIVLSHHTDESVTNVEIATSPIKKQHTYNFIYPISPSSSSQQQQQQQQQHDIQSSIKKISSSPIKDDIPIRPSSRTRTRTSSGTKSAGSSPYISATRPSGVAPSALLLTSTPSSSSSSSSSSSPRLRWLLRILILSFTCLAIYSYISEYTMTIVMTWLLLIPVSIYIVLQFHTSSPLRLPSPSPSISHDSPLLKHHTRRRSSLPGIQPLSTRPPITPTSASTSTSTSTSTSHDIPNVLLTRKPTTTPTPTATATDDKPHRTKLPINVFHTS